MRLADNRASTEQLDTMSGVETDRVNTAESFSAAGSTFAVYAEQPAPVVEVEREDLTSFFAVGIVINLVMITAYFVWAYKQWSKAGATEE